MDEDYILEDFSADEIYPGDEVFYKNEHYLILLRTEPVDNPDQITFGVECISSTEGFEEITIPDDTVIQKIYS